MISMTKLHNLTLLAQQKENRAYLLENESFQNELKSHKKIVIKDKEFSLQQPSLLSHVHGNIALALLPLISDKNKVDSLVAKKTNCRLDFSVSNSQSKNPDILPFMAFSFNKSIERKIDIQFNDTFIQSLPKIDMAINYISPQKITSVVLDDAMKVYIRDLTFSKNQNTDLILNFYKNKASQAGLQLTEMYINGKNIVLTNRSS